MSKIFKTGAKNSILMVFAAAIMAAGFWLAAAPKAEACGAECILDAGVCKYDDTTYGTDYKICTINIGLDPKDTSSGTSTCSSGSGGSAMSCLQDKCPSPSSNSLNGKLCQIKKGKSFYGACLDPELDGSGVWDASKNQCVTCSNKKENKVCGTTSVINTDGSGNCTGSGDGNFETACDSVVAASCDDQEEGYDCATGKKCSSSGTCDTVAATPVLTTITVTPVTATVAITGTQTFSASPKDQLGNAITATIVWSSGDTGKGTINSSTGVFTAVAAGTVMITATSGDKSGTVVVTVQAAGDCVFSGKTFAVSFKDSSYIVGDVPKINFTIPLGVDGCVGIYKPATSLKHIEDSEAGPVSSTNVSIIGGTNIPALNVPGVWKMTISKGFDNCSPLSKCAVTTTVAVAGCVPATCVGCSNDIACPGGTCTSGVCVSGSGGSVPPPVTIPPSVTVPSSVTVPPPPACTLSCTGSQIPNSDCTACIDPPCSGGGMYESPLSFGYCSIGEILAKATDWILSLVSSIIVLVIIIGGLMYISSAGDQERLRASKNIIYYAIIGLGIILISAALINEVTNLLKGT